MKTKIIGSIKSAGDSTFEDSFVIVRLPDSLLLSAADGRKAWEENGDSKRLRQGYESTGQFCAQLATRLVANIGDTGFTPANLMIEINDFLKDQLADHDYDLSHPEGLPGCAAIIVKVNFNGIIEFANLLDARLILFDRYGNFIVPTIDNMDRLDRIALQIAVHNAQKLGVSVRQAIFETDYALHSNLTDPRK